VRARTASAVALFVLFAWITPASAWNNHGHMLVAYLAYQQLHPQQQARADALVTLNPLFARWQQQVAALPASQRSAAIFALAATWPDIIKTDATHHDDGLDGGDRPPLGPGATQNTGYTDLARHKYWHFVDTPFTADGSRLPPVLAPNVIDRIGAFRATLASTGASAAKDPVKSYDLVWLLHLVGDLHQPLHASTRVSKSQPNGDHGGNFVKLCSGCRDQLHGFWDGASGDDDTPAGIVRAALTMHVATGAPAADLNPRHWADESLALAKSEVYHSPIGAGAGPFTVNSAYRQNAQKIATARLTLAAARLAAILNTDLK
jgi:hypothetical protein